MATTGAVARNGLAMVAPSSTDIAAMSSPPSSATTRAPVREE
jgi:hypothetical protein